MSPFTFSVIPTALIYRTRGEQHVTLTDPTHTGQNHRLTAASEREYHDCYSEAGFEAVEGRPVGGVLVPPLAEQQGVVVEEEVSLHGLEPGQLLHPHRRPLMADPHAEASLHHHPAQLAQVSLGQTDGRRRSTVRTSAILVPPQRHDEDVIYKSDSLSFIQNH